ncbi:MAG: hemerythrin domain-containing protein [Planctomycetes bacterium]|nr:hemerythrin domain-containing protein [Planctomycetota bacterium]
MTQNVLDAREIPHESRLETIFAKLKALTPGQDLELVAPHQPDQLLRKVLAEFPRRFDFSPVLKGPVTWRYVFRARTDAGPRTVSDYLAWDHDRLDAIMEHCTKLVGENRFEEARAHMGEFKEGLFRHIEIEEQILFKAFEDKTGMRDVGPTAVMRMEHKDIKEAVNDIVKACEDKRLDEFERGKATLLGVLVEHNMKEEQILYPGTDRMLDDGAREKLVETLLLG